MMQTDFAYFPFTVHCVWWRLNFGAVFNVGLNVWGLFLWRGMLGCLKLSVIRIGEICSKSLEEFVFSKPVFHFVTVEIIS
jgi:hypothetical protein